MEGRHTVAIGGTVDELGGVQPTWGQRWHGVIESIAVGAVPGGQDNDNQAEKSILTRESVESAQQGLEPLQLGGRCKERAGSICAM